MQLSSKTGSMVSDYYPVKTRDGVKQYDRVLRILTFMGQTMSKRIMTLNSMSMKFMTKFTSLSTLITT